MDSGSPDFFVDSKALNDICVCLGDYFDHAGSKESGQQNECDYDDDKNIYITPPTPTLFSMV